MKINKTLFKLIYFIIINFINYQLIFYNSSFININKNYQNESIIIEVDISQTKTNTKRGPEIFIEGIKEILPYNTSICRFISSHIILPINGKNKSDYFFISYPLLKEETYNQWIKIQKAHKLILGPNFVPKYWNYFPIINVWNEKRFLNIIKNVKGIGVHSERVRNYLAQKSNTFKFIKKYKIIRPCSNLKPKYIKPFIKRKVDILFFEKYADLNRRQQGKELLKFFNNSSKAIEKLEYGYYTNEKMQRLANDSKFIIYYSFYDTGAIGLKEIQNYGVFAFTHQKDLVINKDTTFLIPELSNENNLQIAYKIIIGIIEKIIKTHPNSEEIAKLNQEYNKCQNSLDDLCKGLI